MFQKLGLVPPTPPVSFAAANTPAAAERIASFNETLRMSPETGLQHLALFFTSVNQKKFSGLVFNRYCIYLLNMLSL